jgi:hypothetical protein
MTDQQDIQQAEVEGQLLARANEEADPNVGEATTDDGPEVEGQLRRANEETEPNVGEDTTDDGPEVEGVIKR